MGNETTALVSDSLLGGFMKPIESWISETSLRCIDPKPRLLFLFKQLQQNQHIIDFLNNWTCYRYILYKEHYYFSMSLKYVINLRCT